MYEGANQNKNNDVVVVVGKTFEAATLADGSEGIIEKTRYKRLRDNHVWSESKIIQLNEIENVMGDTGVEDHLEKKQAPTWSLSYSGSSESVATVDAAELDAALSASPDGDKGYATRIPTLTPKINRGGWAGRLFSPASISIDEENSVHPDEQFHTKAFASHNIIPPGTCDGDDSVDNAEKKALQRRRRCLFLFLYAFVIITGVFLASVLLLWFKKNPSAKQTPGNTDAGDDIQDTTSDTLDSIAADMADGVVDGNELLEPENVEDGNTEQVDTVVVETTLLNAANDEEEAVAPCIQLKITTEADKESTDITPWTLSRAGEGDSSTTIIGSADSLSFDDSNTFDECVKPGVYTFHISDSGGDGLGERGKTGYVISADGVNFGVSTWFLHDEKMTFSLPLVDESADDGFCSDDFLLVIKTDDKPEETYWDVVDNSNGEIVLQGGPYSLLQSIHTQRACLSDGNYTFNMHDLGGDGVCCDEGKGFFFLDKDGVDIVDSDGQFGIKDSTIFVLSSP